MICVSVIIPTYNRAHTIRRAIDSVLAQNGVDFEIIVVDDCSTDDTISSISDLIDKKKIRFIRSDLPVGASQARNLGAQASHGKYLAFQDSDDEWLPGKLALQVEALEAGEASEVLNYCRHIRISATESATIPVGPAENFGGSIFANLLKGNFISTQTMVMRRDIFDSVGGFDPDLLRYQDWDLALRIADKHEIQFLDRTMVHVHVSPQSLTAIRENHLPAKRHVLSKWKDDRRLSRSLYAYHLYFLAKEAEEFAWYEESARLALQSALLRPNKVRSWILFFKSRISALFVGKKRSRYPALLGLAFLWMAGELSRTLLPIFCPVSVQL